MSGEPDASGLPFRARPVPRWLDQARTFSNEIDKIFWETGQAA